MVIAEKRVYEATEGRTRLAVATDRGLAVVGISADVIGEFGLALREPIRAVAAAGDGRLLAATPDDLRFVALGEAGVAETVGVADTGAGPTVAVAIADGAAVAAGSDGVVRRAPLSAIRATVATGVDSTGGDAVAWTDLGAATVRAADGRLLAAADGVYRVDEDGIARVGLDDVRDVAAPEGVASGGPFAATPAGLLRLGPGWTEERSGAHDIVAAADSSASSSGPRAHATTGDGDLLARTDGRWNALEWPARSPPAAIAYGTGAGAADPGDEPPTFAVAGDGTVLADAGDGWRTRSIGLPGVVDCAVVR